mgnify:CR=1 FL=1
MNDHNQQNTAINWFPGHMAKAIKQIKEKINLVDIVIELVDSRAPLATTNPLLNEIISGKEFLKVFTKIDLADDELTKEWQKEMENQKIPAIFVNLSKNESYNKILNKIKEVMKPKYEKDIKRGLKPRTVRAMVIGIPNVGKSTFINAMAKRKSAGVGNRPGFTRSQQWIRCNDIDLLDTPGILWPNLSQNQNGVKLALIGSIKEEILPSDELAKIAIQFLAKHYHGELIQRYGIAYEENYFDYLEKFALKMGHLYKQDKKDYKRSENTILSDFKNGIIGKITLERCGDDGWF